MTVRNDAELDALADQCIRIARQVRRELGIGMYEHIYQEALSMAFDEERIPHAREVPLQVEFRGKRLGTARRIDLLVERQLVLEIKSTVDPHPVHETQLITYLRGGKWPLGYVLNFGTTPFYVRRKVCSVHLDAGVIDN